MYMLIDNTARTLCEPHELFFLEEDSLDYWLKNWQADLYHNESTPSIKLDAGLGLLSLLPIGHVCYQSKELS